MIIALAWGLKFEQVPQLSFSFIARIHVSLLSVKVMSRISEDIEIMKPKRS